MLRRAFMTGGPAALAAASSRRHRPSAWAARPAPPTSPARAHVGDAEARAVENAVRRIRLLDDRHGGPGSTGGPRLAARRLRHAGRRYPPPVGHRTAARGRG